MCMKYENEYGDCFDLMFYPLLNDNNSLVKYLEEWWNIKINDIDSFRIPFFELLENLHEQKKIEPKKRNECI